MSNSSQVRWVQARVAAVRATQSSISARATPYHREHTMRRAAIHRTVALANFAVLVLTCAPWSGCAAPTRTESEAAASPRVVWYVSAALPRQGVDVPFRLEDGATAYRSESPLLDQSNIVGTQVVMSSEPGSVSLVALLDEHGKAAVARARGANSSITVASYLDGTLALGMAVVNPPERILPICRVRGEPQAARREMEALAARFPHQAAGSASGE
jgi:hypothetical protein